MELWATDVGEAFWTDRGADGWVFIQHLDKCAWMAQLVRAQVSYFDMTVIDG